jgi:FMN phosphatase YigB (HAD superfamily)
LSRVLNPEARQLLETLGARGLRRAVVTNTVSPLAATLLDAARPRIDRLGELLPHLTAVGG